MSEKSKRILKISVICVLSVVLIASIAINICLSASVTVSYLQSTSQIYIMESGIIANNLKFANGKDYKFVYDFKSDAYADLKAKYGIEKIAKEGSDFERALRLMDEFAPRLTHKSNFDEDIEISALPLLEYSLDNKNHGINCRGKAQILNEMCLAIGIYSRKVWLMPYSGYDTDCHVVNEIWDRELNKWIMLDITNNKYWTDENGTPLSVTEIRYKGGKREFCTPVAPKDNLKNLPKLQEKYAGDFIYIMKNLVYMKYLNAYGMGEILPVWSLLPENIPSEDDYILSENSVTSPPVQ